MRAAAVLIGSVFVLAACSQAMDYTYSRKNFYQVRRSKRTCLPVNAKVRPFLLSRRPRKRNAHNWTMRQCEIA